MSINFLEIVYICYKYLCMINHSFCCMLNCLDRLKYPGEEILEDVGWRTEGSSGILLAFR